MRSVTFSFDVISPYAYLAFERLPRALEGLACEVSYQPVLFAGLLGHWGNKGPAEIEPKRAWTFRQVAWLARQFQVPLQTPAQHPFNPLALLRLAIACAPAGAAPSRRVCEQVFRHVWQSGDDPNEPARLEALAQRLAPLRDPQSAEVKRALKDATEAAIARGVFGVPTFDVDGRLFWGVDAIPMLVAYLGGDAWFDGPGWEARPTAIQGIVRGKVMTAVARASAAAPIAPATVWAQSAQPFVAAEFKVPEQLETQEFRLRMLTVHDVVKDYDAVMSSVEHLSKVWPGSGWPEGLTLEQNLIDLGWHQKEFQRRQSFAYTVVNLAETQVLGCVYINPSRKRGHDAVVYFWVRQSELGKGLDARLSAAVRNWIAQEWPFENAAYPGRDIDWETWRATPDEKR